MKNTFTVRKMNLRDTTKAHAEQKLEKLNRFFSDEAQSYVTFTLEKNRVTAEITIRDKSMIYRAEAETTDATDAFDDAFDAVVRRIRKQKTRLEKRLRSTEFEPGGFSDTVEEDTEYSLVRVKKIPVKPLDVEEAILQMNLLGHQFYLFRSADTSQINLIYRRKDGNYGLIEPEE